MFYYGVAAIFPLIMWYLSDGIAKAHHLSDRGREKLNKQFTILAILPIFCFLFYEINILELIQ